MTQLEVIASRTLKCTTPEGVNCEVEIGFSVPKQDSISEDWICCCLIRGGGLQPDKTMTVSGADSLQALLLAITTMRTKLKIYKKQGFKFEWIEGIGEDLP